MPYKKSLLVFFSFSFAFVQAFLLTPAFAGRIDTSSGVDQSFTAGYTQRAFAEGFHRDSDAPADLEAGLDGWQLNKGLNVAGAYDTNIFQSRKNLNADWIFTYTPTVGVVRKTDMGTLGISYDLSYVDYLDNDDLDRFNHSINTNLGFNLDRSGKRLKIGIVNSYKPDTAYATGERTELRSAEAARVIAYSDTGSINISYELSPKTSVTYTQGLAIYDFSSDENRSVATALSSRTHTFRPGFSYKLTPKLSLNGAYAFERVDFYEKGGRFDSDSHVFTAGLSGKLAPKTNASLGVGYRTRDYLASNNIEGASDPELNLAVSQKLSDKLSLTLWGSRALGENFDTTAGANINELKSFVGGNLTWHVLPKVSVDGSSSIGFAQRDNFVTFADPENGTSAADLLITKKVENQFYESSVGVGWNPRPYLDLFLGYKFFQKESSFKSLEYTDHKTVGSVRVKF